MTGSPTDYLQSLQTQQYFMAIIVDPTVTPVYAAKGVLAIRVGPLGGATYQKQDDGETTNWTLNSAIGGLDLQGDWDATANVPNLTVLPLTLANKGKFWVVTVAGGTTLGGITTWNIGDWAVCTGPLGTGWIKVDNVIYANRTLSNLSAPTAFNQDLLPSGNLTRHIGSSVLRLHTLWTGRISNNGAVTEFDFTGVGSIVIGRSMRPNVASVNLGDAANTNTHFANVYTLAVTRAFGNLTLQTLGGTLTFISSSGLINASSSKIQNVVNPAANQDAATKIYVDTITSPTANWTSINLNDNQVVASTFFSYPKTQEIAFHIWQITRGINRRATYTQTISDGAVVVGGFNNNNINDVGVTITKTIVGANIEFQYTSTNTGIAPVLKIKTLALN